MGDYPLLNLMHHFAYFSIDPLVIDNKEKKSISIRIIIREEKRVSNESFLTYSPHLLHLGIYIYIYPSQ